MFGMDELQKDGVPKVLLVKDHSRTLREHSHYEKIAGADLPNLPSKILKFNTTRVDECINLSHRSEFVPVYTTETLWNAVVRMVDRDAHRVS